MRLTLQSSLLAEVAADWLILPVWEDELPSGSAPKLDAKLGGVLSLLREQGDVAGKAKELTPLYQSLDFAARRLLLVGLGTRKDADFASLLSCTAAAAKMLSAKPNQRIAMLLPQGVPTLSADAVLRSCAHGFYQGSSTAGIRKSATERTPPSEVCFLVSTIDPLLLDSARRAEVEGRSTNLVRELVNLPPCDLYPESFAERARDIAGNIALNVQDHVDHQHMIVHV